MHSINFLTMTLWFLQADTMHTTEHTRPAGNSPARAGASPTPLTPGDDDDDEDEAADLDAAGLDLTMLWMVVREGAGKRESAKYDVNNHACACLVFF